MKNEVGELIRRSYTR